MNDRNNHRILLIKPDNTIQTVVAGTGWVFGVSVSYQNPNAVYYSGESGLYKITIKYH